MIASRSGSKLQAGSPRPLFTSFQLEELYNQVESEMVLDLSSACMPAMSLEEFIVIASGAKQSSLRDTILDSLLKTKLSYSSQFGSDECRNAILKLYASPLSPLPSSLLLTSGASEAIFLVMSTMFESGDSIIVQQPIYQSLYQIAADRGIKVIDWNLRHCQPQAKQSSHWDLNELADLIKNNPQTKALVINNPNNPTGLAFKPEELQQISSLLEDRYLICDEVFLFISQSQIPSAINFHPNTIVISDLSKSFNMPGLRLGWICHCEERSDEAIQKPLINKFSSLKNYLSLRTHTLSEALAPFVLSAAPQITATNRRIIKDNIEALYSQESAIFDLSQITKESIEGLCIFPLIKDEARIDQLWNEDKVFLAKGENFGGNWGNYLRIGLSVAFPY